MTVRAILTSSATVYTPTTGDEGREQVRGGKMTGRKPRGILRKFNPVWEK